MRLIYKLLLLSSLFLLRGFPFIYSQTADTVFNQTDKKGLRQGYWKAFYENGKPKYSGFFKDGSPQGELVRYYEDGICKARMNYYEDRETVDAILYYQNGKIAAAGKYVAMKKEGTWKYYSYYSDKLKETETYIHGMRNGIAFKYYDNDSIFEKMEYQNDCKNGKWNQYFQNGSKRLIGSYLNNLRTGNYMVYYPQGQLQLEGQFKRDKMEGKWTYYNEDGKIELEVTYLNGIAMNPEKIEERQKQFFKMVEENKGKLPEPDEKNFVPTIK